MSDSSHPLVLKESMPVLALVPTYYSSDYPLDARLQFGTATNEVIPDEIYVRCWPDWESADVNNEDIEVTTDGDNISIQLKDGDYIYEVIATWNSSSKYSGTVSYSFYTAKTSIRK